MSSVQVDRGADTRSGDGAIAVDEEERAGATEGSLI
jgi:hypothetical protein